MARFEGLPSPVLKWAGGKRQLLGELIPRLQRATGVARYHEPFIGGGAVFFELKRLGLLPGPATISDVNPNLVDVYQALRADLPRLIALLEKHELAHGEAYYYATRELVPQDPVERAARVIYLNKTCFNGLYRENSKGRFNVPIGKYVNPTVCHEPVLRAAAAALDGVEIACRGFEALLDHARPRDLVYLDPPYVPLSSTSSFASYAKGGFGADEQRRLADVCRVLDQRGVRFLLSNSMNETVRRLYQGFRVETVLASRSVNSQGAGRGAVEEALVSNFL